MKTSTDPEHELFTFEMLAPAEMGWHDVWVCPNKKQYGSTCCFGGPPTFCETSEYDLRLHLTFPKVFVRLIDWWRDDLSELSYEVVNGTVCSNREDKSAFEWRTLWHELTDPEKYFILSKHGVDKGFFILEQERLLNGIARLTAEVVTLGAVVADDGWYVAPPNIAEEQQSAIRARLAVLLSDDNLRNFHISQNEIAKQMDFRHVLTMLTQLPLPQ